MSTRPEPLAASLLWLRIGLLVIGLALLVERVRYGSPELASACGIALFTGFALVALSFRAGSSVASPSTPTDSVQLAAPVPDPTDLRARLEAARRAGDPEQVLNYRDQLGPLLDPESRATLDRETLAWLMTLIQRRLRAGSAGIEVTRLVERAADRFGTTPEGASLRASLPTLRRAAGLCATCGRPYPGLADACPDCVRSR